MFEVLLFCCVWDFVDECCQCGHNCGIDVFLDTGDKYGERDYNCNPGGHEHRKNRDNNIES